MANPIQLYHYTCSHSAPQITACWELRPHRQIQLDGTPLIWLTDLDQPDRAVLGLTSQVLRCDRTEHRVTVETADAIRWPVYARRMPRRMRGMVEDCPGVLPMHWWVATVPVPVVAIEAVAVMGGEGRG